MIEMGRVLIREKKLLGSRHSPWTFVIVILRLEDVRVSSVNVGMKSGIVMANLHQCLSPMDC